MIRFVLFLIGTGGAYALLRGWPEVLPPVVRACAAVLLLVAVIGLWARRKREVLAAAKGRRAAGWTDYVAIVMAVLAMESGFLWFLSAAPDRLHDVALDLNLWVREDDADGPEKGGGARPGNWLWDNEMRRPLPMRTNFKPGNRPEVFVRLRDPGDAAELLSRQVYVGAFSLGRYENAAWLAFPGAPGGRLLSNEAGFVDLGERPGRAVVHEVFHSYHEGGQNALTALQGVVMVRVPELLRLDSGLHLLPPAREEGGYEYLAASKPMRLEDLPKVVEAVDVSEVPDTLLALPGQRSFAERVEGLANLVAGSGTLSQRLLNLQNHLRTTLKYSLETTNPRDLDPVENFLFHEQRGHCELFATAGALLARSLGVPARVAYGWAGGTYYESSNLFVFRAREAHAWTEVWLNGYGWVVMDPTPPVAIGGETAEVAAPGERPPGAEEFEEQAEQEYAVGSMDGPGKIGRVLTLAFGVPALLLWLWRGIQARRHPGAERAGGVALGRQPDYLKAWRRACAVRGVPIPLGMPLRRHLRGVAEGKVLGERLVAYHYRVRYQGGMADAEEEQRLLAEIRAWERSM